MTFVPTARTRLIALLGDPVEHSRSPAIQNAAFRTAAVDAVYMALRCSTTDLPPLLRALALSGGGGNVTIPHKEVAANAVDRGTEAMRRTGACNTFWSDGGVVWGDNTDVEGVRAAIHRVLSGSAAGARVLVIGAGGGARAAVYALRLEGAAAVVVANRTAERADALVRHLAEPGFDLAAVPLTGVAGASFDLVINATSLGLRGEDPEPLTSGASEIGAAVDMVYAPRGTPWVRRLRTAGTPAIDGSEMLLHQAAAAFRRWWGRDAPLASMRAALGGEGEV